MANKTLYSGEFKFEFSTAIISNIAGTFLSLIEAKEAESAANAETTATSTEVEVASELKKPSRPSFTIAKVLLGKAKDLADANPDALLVVSTQGGLDIKKAKKKKKK